MPEPEYSWPEYSWPVDLRHLPTAPLVLEPDAAALRRLAARFDLVSVDSLRAQVTLTAEGSTVTASGRLDAQIVQSCAVSGEDLPVTIAEPLALRFVPAGHRPDELVPDAEIELDPDRCDEIEHDGQTFDLGEAVAQSLALAIDPFATGPQADRVRRQYGLDDPGASGPFAALAALKKES